MKPFTVVKQNGEHQPFDARKLEASLKSVGTADDVVREVVDEVVREAHDGMTTHEIYRLAYAILRKRHRPIAIRYSLKKAVAALGPTGFPFEKFVAEIFRAQDYETLVDQIVKGKCVEHETDVVAWKGGELLMVEAKFHTDFELKSDLKVVLYVKARYDDIFGVAYGFGGKARMLSQGWIVTNTKFSSTAIQYGACQPQLTLLGWNYPRDNNLHHIISRYELMPLTALTTLTMAEKSLLLAKGIVLSKALLDRNVLDDLHFDDKKIRSIQAEVNDLHAHLETVK
ncbi:MAG: restriction endonuclease [Patescibacteria group bacterium]|nr:restriction endonuclease [Patescibacteria group bacterium]MDE1945898.1 restriction endonuclease [Patescibacteria group bacterium]